MLWREKEFFRFHLRLIFVLVFAALLCQSEDHQEASQVTERESCANAASAWMKKDIFEEVVKDREQFIFNLLDCTSETHKLILNAPDPSKAKDCKTFEEMIPSVVLLSVINKEIPEAINTTSFASKEQRLILLSVHLVQISHLFRYFTCMAKGWVDVLLPRYYKNLNRLQSELKLFILGFLDTTLMAQWKSGNTTILQNNTDTLINMLINFSVTLTNLLEEIRSYFSEDDWFAVELGSIKEKTLALKTKMVLIKTPIKTRTPIKTSHSFLHDMLQSIIDISTK